MTNFSNCCESLVCLSLVNEIPARNRGASGARAASTLTNQNPLHTVTFSRHNQWASRIDVTSLTASQ